VPIRRHESLIVTQGGTLRKHNCEHRVCADPRAPATARAPSPVGGHRDTGKGVPRGPGASRGTGAPSGAYIPPPLEGVGYIGPSRAARPVPTTRRARRPGSAGS
jgi:hypothetical protein